MGSNKNTILALDGHDGSGKTTLAKLFAEQIGGIYIRPFDSDSGPQLLNYADKQDYKNVSLFGKHTIKKYDDAYSGEILVFDRHWMTVFSLLPESYRHDKIWYPLPSTMLCFSNLENTLSRLQVRSEKVYDQNYHTYYLDLYLNLSKQYNINVLRTDRSDILKCLKILIKWHTLISKYEQ